MVYFKTTMLDLSGTHELENNVLFISATDTEDSEGGFYICKEPGTSCNFESTETNGVIVVYGLCTSMKSLTFFLNRGSSQFVRGKGVRRWWWLRGAFPLQAGRRRAGSSRTPPTRRGEARGPGVEDP